MSSLEIPLARPRAQEQQLMHPCEYIQRTAFQQEEALRLNQIRTTHGLGAAISVALEEATLLGGRRIGALPASDTLYHAYRGDFTNIGPHDIYGLPENDPNVQPSTRAQLEKHIYGYELSMKNMGM